MSLPVHDKKIALSRQEILSNFFTFLSRQGIEYCVVGNSDTVFSDAPGDIDIVVLEEDLSFLEKELHIFALENKVKLVQILQHEQTAWYFAFHWTDAEGRQCFLHPDICADYYRNGKRLLTAEELLTDKKLIRDIFEDNSGNLQGFYVPAPRKEFIYYLLKKIDKQKLDANHAAHLMEVFQQDPEGALSELIPFFPHESINLIRSAAESGHWQPVQEKLVLLRQTLHQTVKQTPTMMLLETMRCIRRFLEPTGLHVVFLGPDGCGKSSVIEKTLEEIAPAYRRVQYVHLEPWQGCLEPGVEPPVLTEPHGKSDWNLLLSVMKLCYLVSKYIVGYFSKIYPKLARSTLVTFDRYYQDVLVDPRRFRYGGPAWLSKVLSWIIPKPALYILLDASPEVLLARKQELPPEEVARQRQEYLALFKKLPNAHLVDASQPLEEIVPQVNQIIMDYMAERIGHRYGF
ncbi:MAG: hypothetical protein KTR14_04475 [Vampirovibrio sp.]|nr:hypothetical protein [Vampirovibrio sp.]